MAAPQRLEIQVVEDEAQVGLAGTVVGQGDRMVVGRQFFEDGSDELVQVVDLLELAPRVLVDLAFAREDVQRLEQFDGLADRKSTRLNSSHLVISYAVFCLKK